MIHGLRHVKNYSNIEKSVPGMISSRQILNIFDIWAHLVASIILLFYNQKLNHSIKDLSLFDISLYSPNVNSMYFEDSIQDKKDFFQLMKLKSQLLDETIQKPIFYQ